VAEASPVPIVLYNVPGRTGSNILPETVLRLAAHPRIAGIKESSGRLEQATAIIAGAPGDWIVLSGEDDLALPLIALGAAGVISVAANAAPARMRALTDACLQGAWEQARIEHYRLRPLFLAQFAETNPMPIKAGLEWLGVCRAAVRLPLVEAGPASRRAMQQALMHAGLLEASAVPAGSRAESLRGGTS
jgi:4-hydroxy-tetrahydrodipicolinate synthase